MCRDNAYFLIFLSDGSEEALTEEKSETQVEGNLQTEFNGLS